MTSSFHFAYKNMTHHKTRTILTLLGVVIGIAAVVALISLSNGLNETVRERLESLGSDKVIVTQRVSTGFGGPPTSGQQLTEKDLSTVERIRDVDIVIPILFKQYPVKFGEESAQTSVIGVPADQNDIFLRDVQRYELAEGRSFQEGKPTAVIGSRLSNSMFSKKANIRDKIQIAGKPITVVGIMEETGNQQDDNAIYMDINALREISESKEEISVLFVKVLGDPKETAGKIESELEDLHKEKLFVALTTEQLITQINSVFGIMSLVLVGIAGISLLVAAFGIMNTMLMAVLERTREIGIMKAVGATNSTVLSFFITESALIGFVGGVIGTAIGYAIAFAMSGIAVRFVGFSLKIGFDPSIAIGGIVFATIIGALSGAYPAQRAAKLDPVEALRYE
ncbi:MAG: ABC transporter permease [Candidatus Aenigmarchaeota archaeon]|nr:ABC transporter permease [Candidatus Aenigmarchaeota archaeon]